MTDILAQLAALGIAQRTHEHPPVATVEAARAHWSAIDAAHTKNLLLKDAGGVYWLVVLPAEQPLDLKALPALIGAKRLRFAPADDLLRLLGVPSGAVSAFALVNDAAGEVRLVIAEALMSADRIALHPLDNTRTTVIVPGDLQRWLGSIAASAEVVAIG